MLPGSWLWLTTTWQILLVLMILYSVRDGWYWFPSHIRVRDDEIGVKQPILRAIQRRNRWVVGVAAAVIFALMALIAVYLM